MAASASASSGSASSAFASTSASTSASPLPLLSGVESEIGLTFRKKFRTWQAWRALACLALADARCRDNGGKAPVLFSSAANRGYEKRLPAPSLCLCTCTVLVPSSPHHRICSLSCVSSFLGKYFTRHARQLFRRLSLAHPTLADAHSSANFEATASASLSHPCSVLGSLDFSCTGTEAVRFCTSRCLRSRSVQP
jgi:hypothetical protein